MRILVHEFISGGGLAGKPVPPSLAREGAAMRDALIADLAAIRGHELVTTVDPRFPLLSPHNIDVVTLDSRPSGFARVVASADAVWLIAPETDRCLERLATRVERAGKPLLSPDSAAIRIASDKAMLPRFLARLGVPHPPTVQLNAQSSLRTLANDLGYPLIVKPKKGAGCLGVTLARNLRELQQAVARWGDRHRTPLLLQRYIMGTPASVALLTDGQRAIPLLLNSQVIRKGRGNTLSYRGGRTPFDHPLASRAIDAAVRTCEGLPGLRGYVGVDVILTPSEATIIEVNPRLTTAYLGVRAALAAQKGGGPVNVAEMALAACNGSLPTPLRPMHSVRFSAEGVIAREPLSRRVTPRRQ